MKLIHITDIHIHDDKILDQAPIANFIACLAHVETHHRDADRVVITGDLTHHGSRQSYAQLREIVMASPLEPRLLLGNHDDRTTFRAVFPEAAVDAGGYVQYAEDTPAGRFLYLDTLEPGTHAGHYGEDRQHWLAAELARTRSEGKAAFIFMHHHPCPIGASASDMIGLLDGAPLRALLTQYRDTIRHIFFGHCHSTLSGSVCGIPMSAPRSTNHPNAQDLSGRAAIGIGPLAPTYNAVLIDGESVVVHTVDFLAEPELDWILLNEDGWVEETSAAE